MQKCFVLFLLIVFCNCVKGQNTDDIKNVINTVIPKIKDHALCTDKADFPNYLIKQVNIFLEKDTLLRLSVEEKQELQNKLIAAQHSSKWKGNAVNSISIIKKDTVQKIMGDSTKIWEYFKKKYPEPFRYTLYSFSRPIFIRNNTVCLFYFVQSSHPGLDAEPLLGDSSSGQLWIYIKNGDTWIKKIKVYGYIT